MRKNDHPVEQAEMMSYLDGELSIEKATEAASHLEECLDCQKLLADLKSVSEGLTEWQIEPCDSQIKPTIAAALDARDGTKGTLLRRRNWLQAAGLRDFRSWAWGAAVGGLAVLLVSFLLLSSRPHTQYSLRLQENRGSFAGLEEPMPARPEEALRSEAAQDSSRRAIKPDPNGITAGSRAAVKRPERDGRPDATATRLAPMIARNAQLTLTTKDFDRGRTSMEEILQRHGGYVSELTLTSLYNSARTLKETFRVPADQLQTTLTELKTLGRVESESQSGVEVTTQYVDLEARLTNARNTEKRLTALLRQQTGKLPEVLAVENEISRVRGEIESMEAERNLLAHRVEFATLNATLTEEYKAQAQMVPDSIGTRFRNAAIAGYRSVVDGAIDFLVWLISYAPTLLLWSAILFFPVRFLWRKRRRS